MLTALLNNEQVIARDAAKGSKGFICSCCKDEVVLVKGRLVTHHFRHKPPKVCSYGNGESEIHHRSKLELYDSLMNNTSCANVCVEKDFGFSRADVYAEINGVRVAVELQKSNLSIDDLIRRTENYKKLNISVLWLLVGLKDLDYKGRYSPSQWERWFHTAYFGKMYRYLEGSKVAKINLLPCEIYVDDYYSEDVGYVGGYSKVSKRYKYLSICDEELDITTDFHKSYRKRFVTRGIEVPESLLYMSK